MIRDEALYKMQKEILKRALLFAEHNEDKFDDTFLRSLEKDLEGYGELTKRQMDTLINIMDKWRMDDYLDRNNLC